MRSCMTLRRQVEGLRRQVQRLKRKEAEAPAAVQLDWGALFRGLQDKDDTPPVAGGEAEPDPYWAEVLKELRDPVDRIEERIREALGEEKPRPCGLKELRPDERLVTNGGEPERAD
jgi:hypothetical protein